MSQDAIDTYVRFFESLSKSTIADIDSLFSQDALFEDPFNRVRGPDAIKRIFAHLYSQHPAARFRVDESIVGAGVAYLRWSFWPDPAKTLRIEGVSRVLLDDDGKVRQHSDYWDSASQLYARLPLIGAPTRWLLKRLQAEPGDQLDA